METDRITEAIQDKLVANNLRRNAGVAIRLADSRWELCWAHSVAHSATTCRIHGVALRFPFALRMVSRPFILTPGADPPTNASSFAKIAADSGQPKKHLAQP